MKFNNFLINPNRFVLHSLLLKNSFLCSRTPGSRQPSPAEEDLSKNGMSLDAAAAALVNLKPPQEAQLPPHHHLHHLPPHHLAPHLGVTLSESVSQQFEHFAAAAAAAAAAEQQQQQANNPYEQQQHQYAGPPPPQPHQVDSAVLQQQQHNFDVQVSESNLLKYKSFIAFTIDLWIYDFKDMLNFS